MNEFPSETKGRRALITGITGQDGRYLAEFLHDQGYEVFGLVTGQTNPKAELLCEELPFVELVGGDLHDLAVADRRRRTLPAGRGLQPRRHLASCRSRSSRPS